MDVSMECKCYLKKKDHKHTNQVHMHWFPVEGVPTQWMYKIKQGTFVKANQKKKKENWCKAVLDTPLLSFL